MNSKRPVRDRTVFWVAAFGLLGWAVAVVMVFASSEWSELKSNGPWHSRHEPATMEGPPVIILRHLSDRGFDPASIRAIEPHFHVLNAALVTIVELKQAYEMSSSESDRDRRLGEAVHFHTTADRHEELIENLLTPQLRERFHGYVREREAEAGLHADTPWHKHEDPAHRGISPGFETPWRGH